MPFVLSKLAMAEAAKARARARAHFDIAVVTPGGHSQRVRTSGSTPVGFLAERFSRLVGHHPDFVRLLYGHQLLEKHRRLSAYNITAGANLTLVLDAVPWQFYAKLPSGESLVLWGLPGTTVDNVKAAIQDKIGMPHERQQLLTLAGQELEDDNTLSDYDVRSGSSVILRHRFLRW